MLPRLLAFAIPIAASAIRPPLWVSSLPASPSAPFTNFTLQLPMRDGTPLNTVVYTPTLPPGARVGTIIIRTPYGTATQEPLCAALAQVGWACAVADERGRFASGGAYTMWASAANDTHDTLAFLADQAWSNGLFAQTGGSANAIMGYVAPLGSDGGPPRGLASQYNIVGSMCLRPFEYFHGAYREELITGWLNLIGEPGMIPVVKAHEGWSDFWATTTASFGERWGLVDYPIAHLAGWYDIFSTLQLADALAIDATGGPRARSHQILVVEAGGHCGGGAVPWPNATWGADLLNNFQLQLYEDTIGAPFAAAGAGAAAAAARADGRAAAAALARVRAASSAANGTVVIWYVLGAPGGLGNFWAGGGVAELTNTSDARLYLRGGGALSPTPPPAGEQPAASGWTADPAAPLPTVGGNVLTLPLCGPQDQRGVEANFSRGLALFETPPLASPLLAQGVLRAELWVASDAADTDVTVKVTDVWPSGESMLVQDGVVRMRWRAGGFAPAPLPPLRKGEAVAVQVEVGATSYIFGAGHRVRVAVASSNYPRFDVNPNTGAPLAANSSAAVVAENVVLHDAAHPSALVLPVFALGAIERLRL